MKVPIDWESEGKGRGRRDIFHFNKASDGRGVVYMCARSMTLAMGTQWCEQVKTFDEERKKGREEHCLYILPAAPVRR